MAKRNSFLTFCVAFLVVAVWFLISLGGLVRNKGAGLSCPDWPLCFGQVIPPMNVQVFLEWFHRLIAGSISLFLLGTTAMVFFVPALRRLYAKYCVGALVLLALQIVLGGMTVLGLLSPKWVVSHLAIGIAFFATLLGLLLTMLNANRSQPLRFSGFVKLCLVAVYSQIILGGLVSSNYAGLACPDFPTCFGEWLPPLKHLVKFQFFHRVGAFVVTFMIIALFFLKLRDKAQMSLRGRLALTLLPVILAVQVALGIYSVLWQLPVLLSVAHLAVATLLLGAVLVIHYERGAGVPNL